MERHGVLHADDGVPAVAAVDAETGGVPATVFAGPVEEFDVTGRFGDAGGDIDINNDGLFPDTLDIDSLLSVFSGGACL